MDIIFCELYLYRNTHMTHRWSLQPASGPSKRKKTHTNRIIWRYNPVSQQLGDDAGGRGGGGVRMRGGEMESKLGTSLSDSSSVHILCGIIYKESFHKMGRTIFPNRHSTPKGARPASSHKSLAISPHTFLNIHSPLIANFSKKGKWQYER